MNFLLYSDDDHKSLRSKADGNHHSQFIDSNCCELKKKENNTQLTKLTTTEVKSEVFDGEYRAKQVFDANAGETNIL